MKWDRRQGRPEPIRALNRILEIENNEPLVDMLEIAPKVRILRPQVIPYARKTVVEMCAQASEGLPKGVYLGLIEGWRPLSRQQRIYDFMWACAKEAFPDRDLASLRRTVCRWVAPTDQKAPPGHCTGAAVDVWLVNEQNEPIDVASPFDRWQAAPTFTLGLSDEAYQNRQLLLNTMLAQGFSNCRDEWWHYSYGDAGWAVRMALEECIYGLVHLDEDLYAGLEEEHAESMKERSNPFLAGRSG